MKVSVMFTVAAIVLVLLGIISFLAPAISALSITDTSAAFSDKVSGVCMLSLGVIAWLVRNAEASKTRDSLVLGYTLLFGLGAVVSVYGSFLDMPSANISWIPAVIQAIIAAGFFMAGRSSMSKSM